MRTFQTVLTITVLSTLLTACLPVVLVGAGATAGTMLTRDSRSLQTISDDTDIQYQVDQAIHKDKALSDKANISNITFNHIVLLVGQAPSEKWRQQAEQAALKVAKVRRVYNQIQITPNIGALQLADDATVSANIKTRLAVTSNINSNNFKYTVENGVVYLMGLTTKAELQRTVEVIRNSSGVKKLVTLVEIEPGDDNASSNSASSEGSKSSGIDSNTETTKNPTSSGEAITGGAGDSDVSFQPVKS